MFMKSVENGLAISILFSSLNADRMQAELRKILE